MKSNPLTDKNPIGRLSRHMPPGPRVVGLALLIAGCAPRAEIPPLSSALAAVAPATDSVASLARRLAPILYVHADETFPLERVVAVVHPDRPIIAYHLLWADDVHGGWIPFTTPTDQEIVWVGHDGAGHPTRVWTYWHGTVVGADWIGKGVPAVDVQWGKHASLPHSTVDEDLPWMRQPWLYWALSWLVPDLALGALAREGPLCFCGGFDRYDQYASTVALGARIDLVIVAEHPDAVLRAVFGEPYSEKIPWPWLDD